MAWNDAESYTLGKLISETIWNNLLGATGSLMQLKSHVHGGTTGEGSQSLGPLVLADFTTAAAPAAPGAAKGRFYVVTGDRPGFRAGTGAAEVLESQANKAAASGYASLDGSTLVPSSQIPVITDTQHGVRTLANAHAHSALSGIGTDDHHAQAHGPAQHTEGTAWRDTYQNASGDETEIAFGAAGTYKRSAGASAAPTYAAIADGDVPATHSGSAHHANSQVGHSGWHGSVATVDHHSPADDHARSHAMDGASDHSAGTQGDIPYAGAAGAWAKLGAGTSGYFLKTQGAGANPIWAAVSAGLSRAGGNTTEATTTSTSLVDLITISGLSVAVGVPVYLTAIARKTTGAAAATSINLKINATSVDALVNFSAANQAENGYITGRFQHGVANYLNAGELRLVQPFFTPAETVGSFGSNSPAATMTSLIIQASVNNASITTGVDELHVYTYAVS